MTDFDIGQNPKFGCERRIPNNSDINYLGQLFDINNRICSKLNLPLLTISQDNFKFMTYNVHMWQGINGKDNFDGIYEVIKKISPDILCLQEVHYHNKYMDRLFEHYILISSCTVNPTYYENMPYMVMILMKKEMKTKIVEYAPSDVNFFPKCSNNVSCFLNQKTRVLSLPMDNLEDEKCVVRISLPTFDLICVHLTAYDKSGQTRMDELKTISDIIIPKRKTIIMGDFNFINIEEYKDPNFIRYINSIKDKYGLTGHEYEYATKTLGWVDLYKQFSIQKEEWMVNYSNWTGFRVDYIFACNWDDAILKNKTKMSTYMYFVTASDHNPMILVLSHDQLFPNNMIPQCSEQKKYVPNGFPILYTRFTISRNIYIREFNYGIGNIFLPDNGSFIDMENKEIMLFNVQPVGAIDWFDYSKIQYPNNFTCVGSFDKFKDPYLTGSDARSQILGIRNGIYVGQSFSYLCGIIDSIYTHYISQQGYKGINKNIFLLFAFSIDAHNAELKYQNMYKLQDKTIYANEDYFNDNFDILTPQCGTIAKITIRNFDKRTNCHKFLRLERVYVCEKNSEDDNLYDKFLAQLNIVGKLKPELFTPTIQLTISFNTQLGTTEKIKMIELWRPQYKQQGGIYETKYKKYKAKYLAYKKIHKI